MGEDRDETRYRRGGSLVGAAILIGLGAVFLLNNLGVLAWSIWDVIFRLWPILLIAAGLDVLIGRRSALGSLLALMLTLALFAGAVWAFEAGIVPGRALEVEEISQALDDVTQAEVVIAPAVGKLHIESLPESDDLVEGVVHLISGERLRRDFTADDRRATFTLQSEGTFTPVFVGWDYDRGWDLALNADVPLDLEISLGAGEADVDLTDLTVSDLEMDMGVGQTKVTLPDGGRFAARISGAIGNMVVVVPAGMEARIRFDTALVNQNLPPGYRHHDDVYTSPGYENADNRVDLEVGLAIGNVTIRHSRED